MTRKVQRLAALLALLSGCGGRVEGHEQMVDAGNDDAGTVCVPTLGKRPVEHACQHAGLGPFVEIVALRDAEKAPDMSRVHHTYRVTLEADVPPFRGFARFRPKREGEQAVLHPSGVRLGFRDGAGELAVTRAAVHDCALFAEATVVSVSDEQSYVVEMRAPDARQFDLFVEHLEAFAHEAWSQTCEGPR